MSSFFINCAALTIAVLPVLFSKPVKSLRTAYILALAASLCLCAVLSALLYSNGGSPAGSLCLFSALVFICCGLFFRAERPLTWLYETVLHSSASLFPLAIGYLLSAHLCGSDELFSWPALIAVLLFAFPSVLVPRFLAKGGTPGELSLPDERPVSPCIVMLILELSVPLGLIFGQSAPLFAAVMLILCLTSLLFIEALWCRSALFALHFSAAPHRRQKELEYLVELGQDASEQLRRQAAQERSARVIGEARLHAVESAMQSGISHSSAPAPSVAEKKSAAEREPSFCAFPMINSLMRRCCTSAGERGIDWDISLQLDTLCGFSEFELCVLFHLAIEPFISAPLFSEASNALIRIRAFETSGYLALSVGCRGLALERDAEAPLVSDMAEHGGWAERSEADGFSILSLVLFK